MDLRTLDPQLGMGHRISYSGHYHGVVAVANLQHKVVAADAEDTAADEGHPGKIQALQSYRSASRRHAKRNAGALQERRRQPDWRLFPAAAANAVSVRVLLNAEQCH